jgi:hypothetical protein
MMTESELFDGLAESGLSEREKFLVEQEALALEIERKTETLDQMHRENAMTEMKVRELEKAYRKALVLKDLELKHRIIRNAETVTWSRLELGVVPKDRLLQEMYANMEEGKKDPEYAAIAEGQRRALLSRKPKEVGEPMPFQVAEPKIAREI